MQALLGTLTQLMPPQRALMPAIMTRESLRLRLGTWLALALESELAAIAAIGTGLNYFLQREIAHAREQGAVFEEIIARKPAASQP